MPNILKVTLDETKNPWAVNVDQKDNANQVARALAQQTITWQLEGNAATGDVFNFEWLDPQPNAGIFGTPEYDNNEHNMTLSDLNNSPNTTGNWIYKLTVQLGSNKYSTTSSITGTTNDPSIKNN